MTENQAIEARGIAFELDDREYQIPADALAQFEIEPADVEPFADTRMAGFDWFNLAPAGAVPPSARPGGVRGPAGSAGARPR